MKAFEALDEAEKNGTLAVFVRTGIIATNMLTYRDYFLVFDRERRLGSKKGAAYCSAAVEMGVHENTIKKAVRLMNS